MLLLSAQFSNAKHIHLVIKQVSNTTFQKKELHTSEIEQYFSSCDWLSMI